MHTTCTGFQVCKTSVKLTSSLHHLQQKSQVWSSVLVYPVNKGLYSLFWLLNKYFTECPRCRVRLSVKRNIRPAMGHPVFKSRFDHTKPPHDTDINKVTSILQLQLSNELKEDLLSKEQSSQQRIRSRGTVYQRSSYLISIYRPADPTPRFTSISA